MRYSQQQLNQIKTKIQDPEYFCREILGLVGEEELWDKQLEILHSVKDFDKTAVRSSNGVGKTFVAAATVLWFLFAFSNSRVITTAPTWQQVEKLLWAEIATLYNKAKIKLGGNLLQTELKLDSNWFALGLSTNEETNFQGHHSENILIVFDEALGVAPPIWDAAEGNLTSNNAKMLVIGNPVSPVGKFYECFKSPIWNKIKISAFDSPNFQGNGIVKPRLVTPKWVEEKKIEWGENSPTYKARVLGEFPVEGEDTLIPLTWVERAMAKEIHPKHEDKRTLGIDVARFGSDSTVFTVYHGGKVLHIEGYIGKATTKTAGRAIMLFREYKCDKIGVDDIGVGGGVYDMLEEQGFPVEGVNFGHTARDSERFNNLKAEIYWNLRDEFEKNNIDIPDEPRLLNEIPSILYEMTSRGKLAIVSKDKMKKLGMKSPDYADSLAIAHYTSYSGRNGIVDYYKEATSQNEENKPLPQLINQSNNGSNYQAFITPINQ